MSDALHVPGGAPFGHKRNNGFMKSPNLVDLVGARAEIHAGQPLYHYLVGGDVGGLIETWTYADLDRRARVLRRLPRRCWRTRKLPMTSRSKIAPEGGDVLMELVAFT